MTSILTSVKKLLGIAEEYENFDPDIIMHINTVFSVLTQLGVGPKNGFTITDKTQTWDSFIPENDLRFESVKSYVYMKVRMMFDPPVSSIVIEAMKQTIAELEWRLNVAAETNTDNEGEISS